MIIGFDLMDGVFEPVTSPLSKATYVELTKCIADELQLHIDVDNDKIKDYWGIGTVLLATFNGDLEAGNIQMRENPITVLRVKRRDLEDVAFSTIGEIPFDPSPQTIDFRDYTALADTDYEYMIAPVDETGIEGIMQGITINPEFEGWWLIDLDNPDENSIQFVYNIEDPTITTEEDRTEIATFSRFPKVYYGQKRNKKGILSGLFIPEGMSARRQFAKLDNLLTQRKPYLLKDDKGRAYIVDVNTPQETIIMKGKGMVKVSVNWTQVGDYNDYCK